MYFWMSKLFLYKSFNLYSKIKQIHKMANAINNSKYNIWIKYSLILFLWNRLSTPGINIVANIIEWEYIISQINRIRIHISQFNLNYFKYPKRGVIWNWYVFATQQMAHKVFGKRTLQEIFEKLIHLEIYKFIVLQKKTWRRGKLLFVLL